MAKRKNKFWRAGERLIIIVSVIIITSVLVKASDNYFGGGNKGEAGAAKCPPDMVLVTAPGGDFCIDKYEASAGAGCRHKDPANQAETRDNLDFRDCLPAARAGAIPWRNISQDQAAVACAKAGKRLPSNEEWYAAALGTPDEKAGWGRDDCHLDGNWEDQPGEAGSGKNCYSAAGAYDMIGNVWEWVHGAAIDGVFEGRVLPASGFIDSTDGAGFPGETNPTTPNPNYKEDFFWIKDKGVRGIARGGFWNNQSDAGQYSVYIVTPPSYAGVGVGYRCAK